MSLLSKTIRGLTGADAANKAADQSSDRAYKQYQESKEALNPYMEMGKKEGLEGLTALQSGQVDLFNLPGIMKSFNVGIDALQRKLSAQGYNRSGNELIDLADYSGNFSRNLYNDEFSRRYSLAQLGQSSAAALSGASIQTGSTLANIGNMNQQANVTASGNFMDMLGSISGAAAGRGGMGGGLSSFGFSDRRLKDNIEFISNEEGYNVYKFNYIWDETTTHYGVMADEVELINPSAVFTDVSGYKLVNYEAL